MSKESSAVMGSFSGSGEDAHATDGLDLGLGVLGEVASLHNDWLLGKLALAEDLHVARLGDVDDRGLVGFLLPEEARLLGHEGPEPLHVDARHLVALLDNVKVAHTDLTEVTRVVLVEVDAVVVLATRVTAATRVLA